MGNKRLLLLVDYYIAWDYNVTDAWKLADYHKIINYSKKEDRKLPISRFAGILG